VGEVGIQRQGEWRRPALYQHWFSPYPGFQVALTAGLAIHKMFFLVLPCSSKQEI
jgi:hypothetical protein